MGTLSVSHVFGASVVCSFPLGYFSLLKFFPFMVTNFNGNSKITLLPFITLAFLVVFGHAQSLDVSCIYLLCHIFSLWIVFTFLIPSFTFSLIVLSLIASFVIGEIFYGLFFFFTHHYFRFIGSLFISIEGFLFSVLVYCSLGYSVIIYETYTWHVLCCAQLLSCVRLCDPMDCGHQAPLSMGLLQARILEWVAMPSPKGSS